MTSAVSDRAYWLPSQDYVLFFQSLCKIFKNISSSLTPTPTDSTILKSLGQKPCHGDSDFSLLATDRAMFCSQPFHCGECWGLQSLGLQSGTAEVQASLFQKPMQSHFCCSPLHPLNLWKCLSAREWWSYCHTDSKWLWRLIVYVCRVIICSFPFHFSQLCYPRGAHRVCGLPGSFALSLSSAAGSILPFQVWLCLPTCHSR